MPKIDCLFFESGFTGFWFYDIGAMLGSGEFFKDQLLLLDGSGELLNDLILLLLFVIVSSYY